MQNATIQVLISRNSHGIPRTEKCVMAMVYNTKMFKGGTGGVSGFESYSSSSDNVLVL